MKRWMIIAVFTMGLLAWDVTFKEAAAAGQPIDPLLRSYGTPASIPTEGEMLLAQKQTQSVTYLEVAPIFKKACITCHSGGKPPDGLRLDTYAHIMAGGKDGPVIVPGNPAKSEISRRVRGKSVPRMPMTGPPWLSNNEMALIDRWIEAGAPEGKAAAGEKQSEAAPVLSLRPSAHLVLP